MFDRQQTIPPRIATDLGQSNNPYVDEGLTDFIARLLDAGFHETDVQQMASKNASQLLGA